MTQARLIFGYSADKSGFLVKEGLLNEGRVEEIAIIHPVTGKEEIMDATTEYFGSGVSSTNGSLYIEYMSDPLDSFGTQPGGFSGGYPKAKIAAVFARLEDSGAEDEPARIEAERLRTPSFSIFF
ncbi:MAG: hypothetical protein GC136_08750 [Alphaproteobacteria bacterium]|nr:hypothetical protein [Alphaproteobacteria bacterium]